MLVGSSPAMQRTAEIIARVAKRRATVLITGETGTGKEMVARAVHMASPRAALPMITVNAAALPENLLEAELFGHVKGAFTGATNLRIGRFEQAHRSTLFLDEIGDLPLEMQTKLLRFLQEREFQRIGSSETLKVDVRLIAATNVDLAEKVAQGKFREDLYYRLKVVPIETPPLRERLGDVGLLAQHFVEKICTVEGIRAPRLSPEAIGWLQRPWQGESRLWPGNVRELENRVERAIAFLGDREELLPEDFALQTGPSGPVHCFTAGIPIPDHGLDFEATIAGIERGILTEALHRTAGNKTAAAELLRLKRTTLAAKMLSLQMGVAGEEAADSRRSLAVSAGG